MRTWIFILLLLGIPLSITARDWTLDVRTACYSPLNKDTKHIYSRAWIDFEVLTSKRISPFWEIWGQMSWTVKKGNTSRGYFGFKDRTRAWILPLSVGVRFIYPVNCLIEAYIGAGVSYSFLKIENRCEDFYYSFYSSSPFTRNIRKNGPGALFKTGLLIDTGDNTFIDLFVDYFLQSFDLGHRNIFEEDAFGRHFKASGFKIGGGFGVNF